MKNEKLWTFPSSQCCIKFIDSQRSITNELSPVLTNHVQRRNFVKKALGEVSRVASNGQDKRKRAPAGVEELVNRLEANGSVKKESIEKVNLLLHVYELGRGQGLSKISNNDQEGSGGTGTGSSNKVLLSLLKLMSSQMFMMVLICAGSVFLYKRLSFLKKPKQLEAESVHVKFKDVVGVDEAKEELSTIVDFLSDPEKYSKLGARLPRGCIMYGPPGTGKTLLAKAVAGEAQVNFFHATGSEFEEMFVGTGAKRIRELFIAAKANAPCVVFIDEIDAVAGKRVTGGIHPFANQTINQLLSEMDGFEDRTDVIVIGATNKLENIDKAMLRPGRFDTRIPLSPPDRKGRLQLFELYISKLRHKVGSIDLETLSKLTIGFTGAQIENLVNSAAINAAKNNRPYVSKEDFQYSHDRAVLGPQLKSRVRTKNDLTVTAYHEAGHTLVAHFTKFANPLHKVTISAMGESGGHTSYIPAHENTMYSRCELIAQMDVCMGGRAAEQILLGEDKVTTGASNDLEKATSLAKTMVMGCGFSNNIGLRIVRQDKSEQLSAKLTDVIDHEINGLLNKSYERAINILNENIDVLHGLAKHLLEKETLTRVDVANIIKQHEKARKDVESDKIDLTTPSCDDENKT